MAVYVDDLFEAVARDPQARRVGARSGHRWCHLWADDLDELHAFAERLGMKRAWFQDKPSLPHYDLTPSKRAAAVRLGAVEATAEERNAVVRARLQARRAEAEAAVEDGAAGYVSEEPEEVDRGALLTWLGGLTAADLQPLPFRVSRYEVVTAPETYLERLYLDVEAGFGPAVGRALRLHAALAGRPPAQKQRSLTPEGSLGTPGPAVEPDAAEAEPPPPVDPNQISLFG